MARKNVFGPSQTSDEMPDEMPEKEVSRFECGKEPASTRYRTAGASREPFRSNFAVA